MARFELEVRATARLSHWNTVEIFDYGHTDDGTFYAVIRLRKEGVNDVSLLAQDASGNARKKTHRAYVDPY